jgi:hypothetical protein
MHQAPPPEEELGTSTMLPLNVEPRCCLHTTLFTHPSCDLICTHHPLARRSLLACCLPSASHPLLATRLPSATPVRCIHAPAACHGPIAHPVPRAWHSPCLPPASRPFPFSPAVTPMSGYLQSSPMDVTDLQQLCSLPRNSHHSIGPSGLRQITALQTVVASTAQLCVCNTVRRASLQWRCIVFLFFVCLLVSSITFMIYALCLYVVK